MALLRCKIPPHKEDAVKDNQCISRLLASSMHEMRNILAIIRESAGLAQDVSQLDNDKAVSGKEHDMLLSSLQGVQQAVVAASDLTGAMDYMAQQGCQEGNPACDLGRVCQGFCLMASRYARGLRIGLATGEAQGPVWAEVPVMAFYCGLLAVLDLCASVGGQVDLCLTAAHRDKQPGITVRLAGGSNLPLALAALTGNPLPDAPATGWKATLAPCHDMQADNSAGQEFFLSVTRN